MGSQKESSRPRKSAALPSWAKESVSSTEQLMSTFYSTQEPSALPGGEAENTTSPAALASVPDSTPRESTIMREPSFAPIRIALAEDHSDENDHNVQLPQSPFGSAPRETQSNLSVTSVIATANEIDERPETAPRTRSSVPRRRQNLASSKDGWSNEVLVLGAFDTALMELLPGKSSALYKELYLRSHGATPAVKEVRATKQSLSSWSGIANRNTLIKHIQHLLAVRLLKRTMAVGDTEGPLYTVRRLEDVGISKESASAFYERISEKVRT